MLRNNMFNLVNQLTQESKSLWRIRNQYKQEAVGNDEVMTIWKKIEKDCEDHIVSLEDAIKKTMKASEEGNAEKK